MTDDASNRVRLLVDSERTHIKDQGTRHQLEACLIAPKPHMRKWFYASEPTSYLCWLVAEFGRTGIIYCEEGFGPRFPWQLAFVEDDGIGDDSGCFERLHGAFLDSFGWQPTQITLNSAGWTRPNDALEAIFDALKIPAHIERSIASLTSSIRHMDGTTEKLPIQLQILHNDGLFPEVREYIHRDIWPAMSSLQEQGYSIVFLPSFLPG